MPDLVLIPIESIIDRNYDFTGVKCDEKRRKAVEGCYSSFYYYDTPQQQIASIVASLVKGHFFIDANKRTALFTYLLLSELNHIEHIEDEEKLADIFVEIAASHKSVEECAKTLFPG